MSELQTVAGGEVVAVGSAPASPALSADALARLPGNANVDPYWRLVAAFLVAYPPPLRPRLLRRPARLACLVRVGGRSPARRAAPSRRRLGAPSQRRRATRHRPACLAS